MASYNNSYAFGPAETKGVWGGYLPGKNNAFSLQGGGLVVHQPDPSVALGLSNNAPQFKGPALS